MNAIVPRCEVTIRAATPEDYAFVDRLQGMHSKALGFMRKAALEGKIGLGAILIAEDENRLPIGYCIFSYRYLKRDELGVVYQMNVVPGAQRKLVAATLLKAVFERAPYGCKLFCCWCAQDLDAGQFWEAMGFVPLAFRTGAVGKKTRTHIFWQRRIREGDCETPYWYPSKTDGGMMREDRIVLPIPPGVHWKDPMPILLPQVQNNSGLGILPERSSGAMLSGKSGSSRGRSGGTPKPQTPKPRAGRPDPTKGPIRLAPGQFAPPGKQPPVPLEPPKREKPKRPAREKVKADPKHVAAARELRDRYLEQFNSGLVLPNGKYQVSRAVEASPAAKPLLLEQAA